MTKILISTAIFIISIQVLTAQLDQNFLQKQKNQGLMQNITNLPSIEEQIKKINEKGKEALSKTLEKNNQIVEELNNNNNNVKQMDIQLLPALKDQNNMIDQDNLNNTTITFCKKGVHCQPLIIHINTPIENIIISDLFNQTIYLDSQNTRLLQVQDQDQAQQQDKQNEKVQSQLEHTIIQILPNLQDQIDMIDEQGKQLTLCSKEKGEHCFPIIIKINTPVKSLTITNQLDQTIHLKESESNGNRLLQEQQSNDQVNQATEQLKQKALREQIQQILNKDQDDLLIRQQIIELLDKFDAQKTEQAEDVTGQIDKLLTQTSEKIKDVGKIDQDQIDKLKEQDVLPGIKDSIKEIEDTKSSEEAVSLIEEIFSSFFN